MEVLTYATEDEGIDGSGEKAWFSVDACRWSPFSNPDCLEVRLAGTDVRVKVPLENVFTDVKGLAWAETRQWRRGLDPTKPQPPPPSLPRKRESSDATTKLHKPVKPASVQASKKTKTLTAGGDKGGGTEERRQEAGDRRRSAAVQRAHVAHKTTRFEKARDFVVQIGHSLARTLYCCAPFVPRTPLAPRTPARVGCV